MKPAPDPRSTLVAQAATDGTHNTHEAAELDILVDGRALLDGSPRFTAAHDEFPPWPCGCGAWACNLGKNAVWVRRAGACVFWIYPNDTDRFAFDADAYARALGGDLRQLPELSEDLDRRVERKYGPFPTAYGPLACDLDSVTGPWAALRDWPRRGDGLEPVPPPASATELTATGVPSIWLALDGGRARIYAPGIVRLPTWLAGPAVDELLDDVDVARLLG